jgi:hypothetical protein
MSSMMRTPLSRGATLALCAALLSAAGPAWAASPSEKLEALLLKGKPEKVLAKVDALIDKQDDPVVIEALRDLEARAWHQVLLQTPDLIGCQRFRDEFLGHRLAPEIFELEARLALEDAGSYDSEAVYRGIASQYPDTAVAREVLGLAEASSFAAVTASRRSDDLRGHVLRYPEGAHVEEARTLELERAFAEAEAEGTSKAWLLLLDRYPGHPRLDDATSALEETSWAELQAGSPSVEGLWRYAADHSDTDNGWKAATAAMDEGLSVSLPDGLQLPRQDAVVAGVVEGLDLDLGAPPPPGFELSVELMVAGGQDSGWVPWNQAAKELTPRLGLPLAALEGVVVNDVVMAGKTLQWRTPLPLCSASEEPAAAKAVVTLRRGSREHRIEQALTIDGRCPGARHLVFLQQGDDLEGPIGLLSYDPIQASWSASRGVDRVNPAWDCSHLESVDSYGASVICGAVAQRVGFEPRHLWLRRIDPAARSSERVDLLPLESLTGSPWTYVKPRRGEALIQDAEGNEVAKPGLHVPMITPAVPALAFGRHPEGHIPTPPVPLAEEDLEAEGGPLPAGAVPMKPSDDGVAKEEREQITALFSAVLGRELELREARRVGPLGSGSAHDPLYDVQFRDRQFHRWSERLLVARQSPGAYGWFQYFEPPDELRWRGFAYGDHQLYRSFLQRPGGPMTLFTLRHDGTAWVVDEAIVEAGAGAGGQASSSPEGASAPGAPGGRIEARGGGAIVLGALDKSLIDAVIARHLRQLEGCYGPALARTPSLSGDLVVKFVITKDGSVSSAATKRSTLGDPAVEACINDQVVRWQFPEPKGGGIVIVSYPFVFSP